MMKKAVDVKPGDRIGDWMVVESRPYTPNPEVMWFIFWKRWNREYTRMNDCSFIPRDMLIEIQHEAYEIPELP